ncbi:hypothetical protein CKAN_01529200 [Cinnamomum micranthum f. kanehirae]|uniref:Uncharacterized protein n=1 Tax=Cinnamomum micranthum f. kanehirae TaxID=337451 RepID=A0A443P6Q0_9MAGN|nr:hypothetical protein CKAN_01529200 [Cinnamomum micranthum f. kanehirae]
MGLPNLIKLFYVVFNATNYVKIEKGGIQMACSVFSLPLIGYVCSYNRHYTQRYGMDNGRAPKESKSNERSARRGKRNCRREINGYIGYAPSNELPEIIDQRDYEVTSSSSITCS